jgi:hypothetical protein
VTFYCVVLFEPMGAEEEILVAFSFTGRPMGGEEEIKSALSSYTGRSIGRKEEIMLTVCRLFNRIAL